MSLRERTRPGLGIIEPCLPSPAKAPPSGPGWIHEIKHDGMRIMARRDKAGVRLITRHGNDFTSRFPFVVAAVTALPARSFLIDGEAIVTNGDGLAVFDLIRHKRHSGCDANAELPRELGIGRRHERGHLLVTGLDEFDLAIGAIEGAEHTIDAVAGIAEHFFYAPCMEPLDKEIANCLGHDQTSRNSGTAGQCSAMIIFERRAVREVPHRGERRTYRRAIYSIDETKRRSEILAQQVFIRFRRC
jgi:hypothetical protein